jgi:hypothetical protein
LGEDGAAKAAGIGGGAPALAAHTACAAVGSATATGVFGVIAGGEVGGASPGSAGSPAGVAAGGIAFLCGTVVEEGAVIVYITRRTRNALALGAVGVVGRQGNIVCGSAGTAAEAASGATPEAHAGGSDGLAAHGEGIGYFQSVDATAGAIPGRGGDGSAQGGIIIKRYADDLVGVLAIACSAIGRVDIAVGKVGLEGKGASRKGYRTRGHAEFHFPGAETRGRVAATGSAVSVGDAVGVIELGPLHLDDEYPIPGSDRGAAVAGGTECNAFGPGSRGGRGGIIGIRVRGDRRRARYRTGLGQNLYGGQEYAKDDGQ